MEDGREGIEGAWVGLVWRWWWWVGDLETETRVVVGLGVGSVGVVREWVPDEGAGVALREAGAWVVVCVSTRVVVVVVSAMVTRARARIREGMRVHNGS